MFMAKGCQTQGIWQSAVRGKFQPPEGCHVEGKTPATKRIAGRRKNCFNDLAALNVFPSARSKLATNN
jgi:hypothetical protein